MSWIEHLEIPPDILNATILDVIQDDGLPPHDGHVCENNSEGYEYDRPCGHDHLQVYHTIFRTDKGDITLEFRNDSNGYYGGSLVAIEE